MINTDFGSPSANSYASVADADAFHTLRKNDAWSAAATDDKEAALVRATDYIDANYRFPFEPLNADQALQNPRITDSILGALNPFVVSATIQLALHMLTQNPNEAQDAQATVSESKSMDGVGSKSTTYADKKQDQYPHITAVISPFAKRKSTSVGTMKLVNG